MANKKFVPAISVIIPMYNIEKYIGECLDSILAQTFQDFEVIVVDDCSKDNGVEVVESYIPKFDGKLQLLKLAENSGGAGKPRNTGLRIAMGEYIFFMDGDDAITPTALEELYKAAENFSADLIHADNCYLAPGETVTTNKNLLREANKEFKREVAMVNAPTFLSDDLAQRVQTIITGQMRCEPWHYLIRRNFLMEKDLKFSNLSIADDVLFSFLIICSAKKILLIPNTFYVWRFRQNSNSREILSDVEKCMHKKGGDIFRSIDILENFMENFELFKQKPEFKYSVFDYFIRHIDYTRILLELYTKVPPPQLDALTRKELAQIKDKTALTAFFFARMNVFNLNIIQLQKQIQQLQEQLKAKVQ